MNCTKLSSMTGLKTCWRNQPRLVAVVFVVATVVLIQMLTFWVALAQDRSKTLQTNQSIEEPEHILLVGKSIVVPKRKFSAIRIDPPGIVSLKRYRLTGQLKLKALKPGKAVLHLIDANGHALPPVSIEVKSSIRLGKRSTRTQAGKGDSPRCHRMTEKGSNCSEKAVLPGWD